MSEMKTLPDIFRAWHQRAPEPVLIDARDGRFERLTATTVVDRVAQLARGLESLGVGPGDRVAILCGDRPEWHIADFAIVHLGAADVPIYPTLQAAQIRPILLDSGAAVIIVENAEQLAKIEEIRSACPNVREVVLIDPPARDGVRLLSDLATPLDHGAALGLLAERAARVTPETLATLIYTSGTTGEPKGVMLTHDNFTFDAMVSADLMEWPEQGETALVFLPLCHVLERLVGYVYFSRGVSPAYCGILESVDAMRRVHPEMFAAVPRFYEKVYDRILHEVAVASALKRSIFRAAAAAALRAARERRRGLNWWLFNVLVYRKLRAVFGGRVRFSISGGAPLSVAVGEFFQGIGIRVLEGYGLTETSPVIAVNTFERTRLGTVGPPIPGAEVRIAGDGEVLVRGRMVMRGYWNRESDTRAAIDEAGWFATGDIGELDPDGYLKITDRKKDLLVTAGGKNIAPQPIEARFKTTPLVETAVLFGDRKPYVVALIVPSADGLQSWAQQRGLAVTSLEDLCARPEVIAEFQRIVDEVNAQLARYETIKKFRLIATPFSIAGGELTPTLKVKRRVIAERRAAELAEMYGEGA